MFYLRVKGITLQLVLAKLSKWDKLYKKKEEVPFFVWHHSCYVIVSVCWHRHTSPPLLSSCSWACPYTGHALTPRIFTMLTLTVIYGGARWSVKRALADCSLGCFMKTCFRWQKLAQTALQVFGCCFEGVQRYFLISFRGCTLHKSFSFWPFWIFTQLSLCLAKWGLSENVHCIKGQNENGNGWICFIKIKTLSDSFKVTPKYFQSGLTQLFS